MKRLAGLLFACLALGMAPMARSAPVIKISDPSICLDGMQTDPGSDEGEPILVAAGCTASQPEAPISI